MRGKCWRALATAGVLALATEARAGYSIIYSFAGLSGGSPGGDPVVKATVPAGVVASPIVRGKGVTAIVANNALDSVNWAGSVLDATQYYGFMVTPARGVPLRLSSLTFTDRRSAVGPRHFQVRYSLNNFATSAIVPGGSYTLSETNNHRETFNLSMLAALQSPYSPVSFRIYGYSTTDNRGAYRLGDVVGPNIRQYPNNLVLAGGAKLAAVPEPASVLLVGVGAIGIIVAMRRRAA